MQKKLDWPKISPFVKNLQFSSDPAEISAILPTHELVILIKFRKDWSKIVDFLVIAKFCSSQIFFASVYRSYFGPYGGTFLPLGCLRKIILQYKWSQM